MVLSGLLPVLLEYTRNTNESMGFHQWQRIMNRQYSSLQLYYCLACLSFLQLHLGHI